MFEVRSVSDAIIAMLSLIQAATLFGTSSGEHAFLFASTVSVISVISVNRPRLLHSGALYDINVGVPLY